MSTHPTDDLPFADRVLYAALDYAKSGFRVLPLRPGTKIPALTDWTAVATTSPETVATWFTGEYVGYNLGVATGRASDLWVLDVDLGHGEDAARSLVRLLSEGNVVPPTRRVSTPSGGLHYWYAWPDEVPDPDTGELPSWHNVTASDDSVLGPGIDVRAEGGQVAVWPSVLADGTAYERPEGDMARLSGWLAERTRWREPMGDRGKRVRREDLSQGGQTRAERYALAGLDGVLADLRQLTADSRPGGVGYAGAPWDKSCFEKACRLVELANADWSPFGLDDAHALFLEAAPRDEWFTAVTVETKWRSALRTVRDREAKLPDTMLLLSSGSLFGDPTRVRVRTSTPTDGGVGEVVEDTEDDPDALPLLTEKGKPLFKNIALRVDEADLALGTDGATWVYAGGVWNRDADAVARRATRLLGNAWNHNWLATVQDHVSYNLSLRSLGDGVLPDLINTRSGMLDWQLGVVVPHDPDYKSTIQLPVEWDPDAVCPRFDAWVDQVAPGGVAERLWQVVGYMVAPGNPLQRAVLLMGDGGNGKGTLIRVLQQLLGRWNTSSVTLQAMADNGYGVADLYGKQANLAGDIDSRYLRHTGTFKMLTGGDQVEARRIYRSPFTFTCRATPLFSANEAWRSADVTEGYRRRWVVVPMDRKVRGLPKLDESELHAELPGILVKAVAALRRLMAAGEFTDSVETQAANEEFALASDVVRTWLAEDDLVTFRVPGDEDAGHWTYRTAAYNRFARWCAGNGHTQPPSSGKFYRHLASLGYVERQRPGSVSTGGGRGFLGLSVDATADGFARNTFS